MIPCTLSYHPYCGSWHWQQGVVEPGHGGGHGGYGWRVVVGGWELVRVHSSLHHPKLFRVGRGLWGMLAILGTYAKDIRYGLYECVYYRLMTNICIVINMSIVRNSRIVHHTIVHALEP